MWPLLPSHGAPGSLSCGFSFGSSARQERREPRGQIARLREGRGDSEGEGERDETKKANAPGTEEG